MIEVATLIFAGLAVLLLWRLLQAVRCMQRMLYTMLIRRDGRPQAGDEVTDNETGQVGRLMWRQWDAIEERGMVDFGGERAPRWVPLARLECTARL